MSGFAQLIFLLLILFGLVFFWSAAGFIYTVVKLSKEPSDDDSKCKVCEYLCKYAGSLTYQEQILLFPNLVVAYIACKIIDCSCK